MNYILHHLFSVKSGTNATAEVLGRTNVVNNSFRARVTEWFVLGNSRDVCCKEKRGGASSDPISR